jgi:hypothetical protein
MTKHQTDDFPIGEGLNPSNALPPIIKKADVWQWEADLKPCLLHWMHQPSSPFPAVQDDFKAQIPYGMAEQQTGNEFHLTLDLHRR